MESTKTLDGIHIGIDANGLYNFGGRYEHRGNLKPEQARAVFEVIHSLTYAELPAAIKRVRAGKPAAKPAPKPRTVCVWTPEEIRSEQAGYIVCPKSTVRIG